MKLSPVNHASGFGNLGVYIRGVVMYRLSPFEQRAFAGASNFIPKTLRRIRGNAIYMGPPLILGYILFSEVEKRYHHLCRKNPDDFANDK